MWRGFLPPSSETVRVIATYLTLSLKRECFHSRFFFVPIVVIGSMNFGQKQKAVRFLPILVQLAVCAELF